MKYYHRWHLLIEKYDHVFNPTFQLCSKVDIVYMTYMMQVLFKFFLNDNTTVPISFQNLKKSYESAY